MSEVKRGRLYNPPGSAAYMATETNEGGVLYICASDHDRIVAKWKERVELDARFTRDLVAEKDAEIAALKERADELRAEHRAMAKKVEAVRRLIDRNPTYIAVSIEALDAALSDPPAVCKVCGK